MSSSLDRERERIVRAHVAAEEAGDWAAALATFHTPRYEVMPTSETPGMLAKFCWMRLAATLTMFAGSAISLVLKFTTTLTFISYPPSLDAGFFREAGTGAGPA